jgi:hypothetical protein
MHLTCLGRVYPDLPCPVLFDEEEWKLWYCLAKRTKEVPQRAYPIKEAVDYAGCRASALFMLTLYTVKNYDFSPEK